jgi:hypothetical protein
MAKKKKLVSIFSALWLSLTNKNKIVTETSMQVESLIKETKLKSSEKEKTKTTNKQLQDLINELNELQVHILVTIPFKDEKKEDILLSLMSEARLDSEQALIDYRHRKLLLTRSSTQPLTNILKKDRYSISEILRANRYPIHAKTYRNAKSYSIENSCGYKSICPIFFDKVSAENFLIKSSRETILLLRNMPLKSNKEILKGFLNTKIKTIGLGDLIKHFSNIENETIFNKIEFLFVPYINELENLSKIDKKKIENIIKTKTFAFYHDKFLRIQEN